MKDPVTFDMSSRIVLVMVASSLVILMMKTSHVQSASFRPDIDEIKLECAKNYQVYYDHGLRSCESCADICVNAAFRGTEQQCNDYCPDYLKALECEKKEDEFFDDIHNVCSPCSSICDDHEYMKTTIECKAKCAVYLAKQTPEQVASLHKSNSLVLVEGEESTESSSSFSLHPGWMVAIGISCLAILCTTVVVVAYMITRNQYKRQRYVQTQQNDRDLPDGCQGCPRESAQPVEETRPHGPVYLAVDSGVNTQGQFALSDLGNRINSSAQNLATL